MIPDVLLLAWSSVIWTLLAIVVFFVCIILTAIILIQDSKDTGLTSAFGGAGGGSALLGARMHKDLAKLTAILGAILAICLLIMGFITTGGGSQSYGTEGTPIGAEAPSEANAPIESGAPAEAPPSEAEPAEAGGGATDGAATPSEAASSSAPAEDTAPESPPEGKDSE